jgi:small subunit ribosomal protein S4e
MRNMLKIAQNKKEVKSAIHEKDVKINNRGVRDEKTTVNLFDIISVIPSKKNYRLVLLENGKYGFSEEKVAKSKVAKIIGKRKLKGNKTQINLSDGNNFISDIKCNTNDSVVIDLEKYEISKCLEFKEKANALVLEGKHTGEKGIIQKIEKEHKIAIIEEKNKQSKVLIKHLMIIE